jgi:signal transduction histidine kinase
MRDDCNLTSPIRNADAGTDRGKISSRVVRAVDRVLKETLHCDNATVSAQMCHAISQELVGSSSGRYCDASPEQELCTLAACESCVDETRASRQEDTEPADSKSPSAMLNRVCNVSDCMMPCFTLYRDLLLNMPSGLAYHRIIRDETGKTVDLEFSEVNPAFERITGIPVGTASGSKITELLPEIKNDPFDWIGFYDDVARTGEPVTIEQYSYSLKAWYMVELFPKDSDTLTAIFFDITKLKATEQELRSLNEELEKRVEEKTRELSAINNELQSFAYSVAHDLHAPLRAVDGFSRVLLEQYSDRLDETGKHYLERMRLGASRMGCLIDDLLNLSRIAQHPLAPQDVNLTSLAHEIIDEITGEEPQRLVQFTVADNLVAYADPGLMRVVLTNLLTNAWKFTEMKDPAVIEVSAISDEDDQVFFVRDNGIGFDMQYADKIFAPFQRLQSAEEFQGSGIGLSIVQRIIHQHSGRIWAESSLGHGATFFFTLKAGEMNIESA